MKKNASLVRAGLMVAALLASCAGCKDRHRDVRGGAAIRLATSYSLEDSGLFPELRRAFHEAAGIDVKASFVGTSRALAMGRRGEADVVLVHERAMEDVFVGEGFGLNRRDVMYSEFVIVGPLADPAGIRNVTSVVKALSRLAAAQATFLSRGDSSGNHARELSLWRLAEIEPRGSWYRATRAGMLPTLRQAGEQGAYTLADRPTFVVNRASLRLEILVAGDENLRNAYGAMVVNPLRVPGVNYDGALRFVDFLVSPQAVRIVRDFGKQKYGEALFVPMGPAE